MRNHLKTHKVPIFVITLFTVIIGLLNYVPGTILSGWDNLHLEFAPQMHFWRGVFSTWLDFQSFGNVSGMAYQTTVFYALFVGVLKLVFSTNAIRFVATFIYIYIGFLSSYFLFHYLGFKNDKKYLALFGAFYYTFSIPHIQIMAMPYEGFSAFLAFLPLQILLFFRMLHSGSRKRQYLYSLFYILILVFGSIQFLTQTTFVVYFIVIGLLSLSHLLKSNSKKDFKRVFYIFSITIVSALFWLLPQLYFLGTSSSVVTQSKINQMATPSIVAQNLTHGELNSFVFGKGLYMDLYSADGLLIFANWLDHFSKLPVRLVIYGFFGLLVLGIFGRGKERLGFLFLLTLLCIVFLPKIVPFNWLNQWLRSIPLLNQIFRAPFTKFASVYSLVFAYFLIIGVNTVLKSFAQKSKRFFKKPILFVSSMMLVLFMIVLIPFFRDGLFAEFLSIEYPKSYVELADYFQNSVPVTSRVALLPDASYWGWFKYSWGYEGSGFLWYMIPQPVVSRTFDVWGFPSESFYWELKYALESERSILVDEVFAKYQVEYLVFDRSLLPLTTSSGSIRFDDILDTLSKASLISEVATFDNLTVFRVRGASGSVSFSSEIPIEVSPEVSFTEFDVAYIDEGIYLNSDSPDVLYPFLSLTTVNDYSEVNFFEDDYNFYIEKPLNIENLSSYELVLPDEDLLEYKVFLGEEVTTGKIDVALKIEDNTLLVTIPKNPVHVFDMSSASVRNCGDELGEVAYSYEDTGLHVKSKNRGVGCLGFESPLLAHWNGYLVNIVAKNVSGNPILVDILGSSSEHYLKTEDYANADLSRYILPAANFSDDGYVFSFQNTSYGLEETYNVLSSLSVHLFPDVYLKNIKLKRTDITSLENTLKMSEIFSRKFSSQKYTVQKVPEGTLYLWQQHDPGWVAFCGFNLCDAVHYKVNNWANAWIFENETLDVTLLFVPGILMPIGLLIVFLNLFIVFYLLWKEILSHSP